MMLQTQIFRHFGSWPPAALLQRRVRDGVVLRLIGKWLNAGVMEDGAVSYPHTGSPQGGVISPMLANVYLHYVLDEWIAREVQPRLRGRAFVVRYADDFVIGFTREDEWCRLHRHHPIAEQHQTLSQKLRGHFAYYGITGNSITLARFRQIERGHLMMDTSGDNVGVNCVHAVLPDKDRVPTTESSTGERGSETAVEQPAASLLRPVPEAR